MKVDRLYTWVVLLFRNIFAFSATESASITFFAPPVRPAEYKYRCPSNVECSKLPAECIQCKFNFHCEYGQGVSVECSPLQDVVCHGVRNFSRKAECKYCWQTSYQICKPVFNCSASAAPMQQLVKTVCWANETILCMGNRTFYKRVRCNWTSGYKWSTAMILSVTLGGFGADRFYLGQWRSGLGKLFSFGGVGVWTIVDVILIATGYVGPADGSVYMP